MRRVRGLVVSGARGRLVTLGAGHDQAPKGTPSSTTTPSSISNVISSFIISPSHDLCPSKSPARMIGGPAGWRCSPDGVARGERALASLFPVGPAARNVPYFTQPRRCHFHQWFQKARHSAWTVLASTSSWAAVSSYPFLVLLATQ